jgi:NodT family efflux transporter outer membrane factor (OMF) lipoprotein
MRAATLTILKGAVQSILAGGLIASTLASCAVGPDYVKPQTDLAPFHNIERVQAQSPTAAAPALDTWWTGFNDPMLVTIVDRALDQNLDLEAAFARVQQARASAQGAGAQLLPTLDLDGSATATKQSLQSPFGSVARSVPGYTRNQREYLLNGAASWEIDIFGGLRRQLNAARDELQAAEAEGTGTRITVAADAADAYFQIRGYQARLTVAQSQIDTDAHLLKLVEARHEFGRSDAREVAQAEALLKQARASLAPLHIGLEQQLNRLDVLTGLQPGTSARELGAQSETPSIPAIGGDDQPLDVLRRRPDVIAAERRLAASNERIGAALSDYYPKISLSGALGFDSLTTDHFFNNNAFQAVGGGALRWRLFDFGKVDAEVGQARGAEAEALARYRQSVLKAAEDVEDALMTLSETQGNVSELRGEVDALQRARDLSEKAYEGGSITLTDVLDADRQLLTAQDQLESDKADAARAAVSTFRALGGGWRVPSVRSAAVQGN